MKTAFYSFFTVISISFFMMSCSDSDPCLDITCLNGAICLDGNCICETGYTGVTCDAQITPSIIRITKITITKFPSTEPNGAGWDVSSGADIYPSVQTTTSIIWEPTTYIENASPSGRHSWSPVPFIELTSPSQQIQLLVYDYDDTSADDWMGGINWVPYSNTGGFPTVVTVDAGGDFTFEVELDYSF